MPPFVPVVLLVIMWAFVLCLMIISAPLPPRPEPLVFEASHRAVLLIVLGAHVVAIWWALRGEF